MALLVERAQAVNRQFAIDEENAVAVADICRRLDGLPLAIELAAARMHAFGPLALQKKLAERFTVLTKGARTASPKHQTLYAAVDWSHELLGSDERALFRRLDLADRACQRAVGHDRFEPDGPKDLLF